MSWTAKLTYFVIDGVYCNYVITYSNGQKSFDKGGSLDKVDNAAIESIARAEIARLEAVAASTGKISYREGDAISIAPVNTVVIPTPEQMARSQFNSARMNYLSIKQFADVGLIEYTDKRLVEAFNVMESLWLDSYAEI